MENLVSKTYTNNIHCPPCLQVLLCTTYSLKLKRPALIQIMELSRMAKFVLCSILEPTLDKEKL